jgi:fumarylacetoacetase
VALVEGGRHLVTARSTALIDLHDASLSGAITSVDPTILQRGRLNELLDSGKDAWMALREELQGLELGEFRRPQHDHEMVLAWDVQDYVDFYSSREHAENAGRIFRFDEDPLTPNWLHLPVGYHGRAATVVVDGTPVRRPSGQRLEPDGSVSFGPCRMLDFELEVGTVLGGTTAVGQPVPIDEAAEHLFGVVLVNDWSARDIQRWEAQPLGPFLGKSFATTASAWVVPFGALDSRRRAGPAQRPAPLPYLRSDEPWHLDIDLQAAIRPAGESSPHRITNVNAGHHLYWSAAQQLAHLTSNGAAIRAGDLFASGTVSGSQPHQLGSLLELSWNGTRSVTVGDASRTFLEDGDEVILTATAGDIVLGPSRGVVTPA